MEILLKMHCQGFSFLETKKSWPPPNRVQDGQLDFSNQNGTGKKKVLRLWQKCFRAPILFWQKLRRAQLRPKSDLRKNWIPLGCWNSSTSVGKITPEKIYGYFDANLNSLLDCKSCTMSNNDSTRACVFLEPTFPSGNETFWRLRGMLYFSKARLRPNLGLGVAPAARVPGLGLELWGLGTLEVPRPPGCTRP